MCDASAAVPIDQRTFIVADDEDNVLRAYDVERPGPPLWSVDVSSGIGVSGKPGKPGKPVKAPPEADIEAATRLGELAFWMTSHGRNSKAKLKPERLKLFATSVPTPGAPQLSVVGEPYGGLLDDLLSHPSLEPFHLSEAAELAPKAPGGFNLEGMAERLDGGVWMGFRNPIPGGKALVISLLNPEQVVRGQKAALGEPRLLELGGWGVRALSQHAGRYLILAGPFASVPGARLYTWDGVGEPRLVAADALSGLSPEGFFSPVGSADVLVLSDDGSVPIDGRECKSLTDAAQKRFRARWIRP
ncbi:MAG TPA: DUF3616 domain-containing protein [Polyangiaceae bacterium]